jgi:ClpP class serine protease
LKKNKKLLILTFVEEQAVNAGYLLATAGETIYVDRISVLGGIEVGLKKLKIGGLIDRVQYKT